MTVLTISNFMFKIIILMFNGINFWTVIITLNSLNLILSLKLITQPWKGGSPNLNNKAGVINSLIILIFITIIDIKIHNDTGDCLIKYFILDWVLEKDPLLIKRGINDIIESSSITHWKIYDISVSPIVIKIKFKNK